MRRLRGDRGAIAPMVPILAFVLLLLGGLVIDASRLLNARGRAVAFAEEAARAGASAILEGQAVLAIDRGAMDARIDAYCDAVQADPTGGVTFCDFKELRQVGDGDPRELVVEVEVRLAIPASLLGMIGVETLRASAVGSARPFEGVDPRDVDSSPPPVDVPVPVDPPGAPPEVDVEVFPEPIPSVEPSIEVSVPPLTASPDPSASPQESPQETAPSPTSAAAPSPTSTP